MSATPGGQRRFSRRPDPPEPPCSERAPSSTACRALPWCPPTTRRRRSARSSTPCAARRRRSTSSWSTTARRTRPRRSPSAPGVQVLRTAVQPRHRRRRAGGLHVRPRARLRLHGPGRRRRAARSGRDDEAVRGRPGTRPRRHDLRVAVRDRHRLHRPDQPPHRHPPLRLPAVAAPAPAGHGPDIGVPPLQPPRDRALRARLPARLSRGGGGADAAPPPPDDARGAGDDAPARRRRLLDRRLRQVRSTTWSRCCSRCSSASAAGAPCRSPASRPRWPPTTGSDGHPAADRRHHRRRRAAAVRARAGAPARAAWSATRCCGCSARS